MGTSDQEEEGRESLSIFIQQVIHLLQQDRRRPQKHEKACVHGKNLKNDVRRLLLAFILIPFGPDMVLVKCQWISEATPCAVLQIGEKSPTGILSADRVWKGKVVRSLVMGQANGYGSRWWWYKNKQGQTVDGGALLTVRDSHPTRGTTPRQHIASKQALLIGLGSNLYYTGLRGDSDLIRSAEGFWKIQASAILQAWGGDQVGGGGCGNQCGRPLHIARLLRLASQP